ncbi:hypothetical protein AB0B89_27160 [Sphaerisporangium sp. NPDC049002]|uniref:hypothetical protein n=1 Tax=Sphaerisporangium sp. NPDC049002 TaxID=3155392 RepID=UPI0033E2837B
MGFDIFARDVGAKRTFDSVGDSAERLGRRTDRVGSSTSELGGHFSKLGGQASVLGSGLGMLGSHLGNVGSTAASLGVTVVASAAKLATFAAAGASAASSAGGLVAALAPAGGIVAALPGALALGAGALVTFKVALIGVGDAFSAALGDDPKKFEESLQGLAPAAQGVARELAGLKGRLTDLKNSVQDALFAPLQGQLTALVDTLGGPLRDGMSLLAGQFGDAGRLVAEFARSADSVRFVEQVFANLSGSVASLTPSLAPLLAGFRDVAAVGAGFVSRLSPGLADLITRFGEFLSRAAASGQALQWMENALLVFRQLGGIAKDVGAILKAVFGAMRESGSDALGVIGRLVDGMAKWANSAKGQEVLVRVFSALNQIGDSLIPVVQALASGIGSLAPIIGQLALAVGPILTSAIGALAPALAALGPGLLTVASALGAAFANPQVNQGLLALGTGISNLLIAVSPLIAPLVELAAILVERFGNSLTMIAAFLQPVTTALAGILLPLLPQLAQFFRDASAALLPFAQQLGDQLAASLRDTSTFLAPVTDALREVGSQVLRELLAVLPQVTPHFGALARAFAALFVEVVKILPDLIRFGGEILVALIKQVPVLAPMVVDLAMAFLDVFRQVTPLVPSLLRLLLEVVKPLIPELPKLIPPFVDLVRIFADLMREASPLIKKLLESPEAFAAVKFLAANGVLALNTLRDAFNLLLGAAQLTLGILFHMPDQVNAGLGRMGDAIKSWINAVIGWFESLMNSFAGIVPGLPQVHLPRLADGGIITRQTVAVVGEDGPEVVIPLTRPARAMQLAGQSGLLDMLSSVSASSGGLASMRTSMASALGAGGRAAPVVVQGGDLHLHFAGSPLISRDEIARVVMQALADARARGFNVQGAVVGA